MLIEPTPIIYLTMQTKPNPSTMYMVRSLLSDLHKNTRYPLNHVRITCFVVSADLLFN